MARVDRRATLKALRKQRSGIMAEYYAYIGRNKFFEIEKEDFFLTYESKNPIRDEVLIRLKFYMTLVKTDYAIIQNGGSLNDSPIGWEKIPLTYTSEPHKKRLEEIIKIIRAEKPVEIEE